MVARGDMFLHAHWVQETPGVPVREWPPETCIVASVTKQRVHYRTLPDGDLWFMPAPGFDSVVKEWLTPVS